MPRPPRNNKKSNGANLGFEATLWAAADKLRANMDAAEYKHVVLGLIFLKYVSDAFEEMHARIAATPDANPEDRDEYKAGNIFWVPKEARWSFLQANAKQPSIGKLIDNAMDQIEHDNSSLKGVLPKDYARPALDKQRLGELIDLIGTIGLGDKESKSKDILGRVYEYFLSQLAKMNLVIRGIDNNLGPEPGDSFHRDLHKDLKTDFGVANPPFNDSDWGGDRLRDDVRGLAPLVAYLEACNHAIKYPDGYRGTMWGGPGAPIARLRALEAIVQIAHSCRDIPPDRWKKIEVHINEWANTTLPGEPESRLRVRDTLELSVSTDKSTNASETRVLEQLLYPVTQNVVKYSEIRVASASEP